LLFGLYLKTQDTPKIWIFNRPSRIQELVHDRSRFYSDYIRCLACASGVDITRTRYFHLTQRRLSVDKPDAVRQKIRRIQKTQSVIRTDCESQLQNKTLFQKSQALPAQMSSQLHLGLCLCKSMARLISSTCSK